MKATTAILSISKKEGRKYCTHTSERQVCLYLKSDGLAREGLHKNLHPGTWETQKYTHGKICILANKNMVTQ